MLEKDQNDGEGRVGEMVGMEDGCWVSSSGWERGGGEMVEKDDGG